MKIYEFFFRNVFSSHFSFVICEYQFAEFSFFFFTFLRFFTVRIVQVNHRHDFWCANSSSCFLNWRRFVNYFCASSFFRRLSVFILKHSLICNRTCLTFCTVFQLRFAFVFFDSNHQINDEQILNVSDAGSERKKKKNEW